MHNISWIGLLCLLCLPFIGLKLAGYIAWSWWWVLAPVWLPIAILTLMVALAVIIAVAVD